MPFSPLPLSRYPPIPQYAIPSVDVTLPPSSREPPDLGPHALPSVSSHSYRWPRISNIPISALPCALVLTLYLYLSSPSPPSPSFLSSFGPCFPFPLSPSHPLSPLHRPTGSLFSFTTPICTLLFPSVSYLNIFSLSITLRRGSICSLLDMPVSTLYSLRFSPSVPLSRSYLISVLIDCWVLTTYIYLYSESYFVLLSLFLSLSLFSVSVPCPVFVLFCLPHFFIVEVTVVGVEKQKQLPQARACTGAPELDLRGRFTDIPFRSIIPVAVICFFTRYFDINTYVTLYFTSNNRTLRCNT